MKNLFSPENAQFIWALLSVAVISTFLFLVFKVLVRLGKQKKESAHRNDSHVAVFFLAACMLCSCSQVDNVQPVNIKHTSNSEFLGVISRPVMQQDTGKTALFFQNEEDADKYLSEFDRTMRLNNSGDSTGTTNDALLAYSKINVSEQL